LLSRDAKRNPLILSSVCGIVLVGIWFERYVLVVPSLWQEGTLPLGWLELFITLGFFAGFAFSYLFFMPKLLNVALSLESLRNSSQIPQR
jgi:molybdopterin-containing oxidoreductase family membrane subunit